MGLRTPENSMFWSCVPRTIQIIKNVDAIQIFASVHLLLRVDHPRYLWPLRKVICQYYRISENVNWIFFRSWHTHELEKRNYSWRFQFVCQPDIYDASVRWVVTSALLGDQSATAKIYICQSSYITKVWRLMIHSFPQYVQRDHLPVYRTCRVTQ